MAQGVGTGEDVEVKFGANIEELKKKITEITGIFSTLTTKFAALGIAAAGGAAFKSFIDTANEVNSSAENVGRTLGITATEAGVLAEAIGDVAAEMGKTTDVDAYTSAFMKFNRALAGSDEELKKLGVDIDAIKSGQLSSNEAFAQALKVVSEYAPGIQQTQAAMKLFGRSIGDVQVLMRVTNERLRESEDGMRSLNRTITAEGVAAARAYRVAMDNVGDVMEGIQKTIGEAIMPVFTELANMLSSTGPAAVQVIKGSIETFVLVLRELQGAFEAVWSLASEVFNALRDLIGEVMGRDAPGSMDVFREALSFVHAAFIAFRIGVETIVGAIRVSIQYAAEYFRTFAEVASRALELDFKGAEQAWIDGTARQAKILEAGVDRMADIARKGGDDIRKAFGIGADENYGNEGRNAKTPRVSPGRRGEIGKEDGSIAAARLALMRSAQQAELALTLEYLRQAGAIYAEQYAQGLISVREFYDAKTAIETRGLDASIELKRREAAEAGKAAQGAGKEAQRLQFQAAEKKLLGEIAVLEAQRTGVIRANTAEYEQEMRKRGDALRAIRADAAQQAAAAEIAIDRGAAQQQVALGRATADQMLQAEREFARRSLDAALALNAEKQALARGDVQRLAELNAQKEQLEREHAARIVEIDRAAELEKAKYSLDAQRAVKSSFADEIKNLLAGTKRLGDAFRDFGLSVARTMDDLIARKLSDKLFDSLGGNKVVDALTKPFESAIESIASMWIEKEAVQTAATEAGVATRVATEEAGSAQSLIIASGAALKRIGIAAWEAAAAVYASIAAIPFVGPFLAPAAAIAASVAVLGFGAKLASAEGGWWQVPGDQMANIHKNEMVLPANEAEGLRSVIRASANGQQIGAGSTGGGDTYQVSISALDGASVERVLMKNSGALVKALTKATRDGKQ